MKIGIDMRMSGTKHGGIGRYVFELVKNILEIDNKNNYTLFFHNKTYTKSEVDLFSNYPNVKIVYSLARHYSFFEQTAFLRLLNKHNLDLMHFPNFNVPYFYNKPFIVTIHDLVHHKISGAKKTHALHFWGYKKIIEHAAKASKKIITVSESSANDISKILDVDKNKIQIIYEGATLTPNTRPEQIEKVKRQYLIKKPYFLFVGVLERKKNVINLTRAFDIFLKNYNLDMDLVLVGKVDKHYPEIKHHALDITNSSHLIFTGYIEDQDLKALYSGAFAYVNASANEGFGLPGVEALQFGLPLVVSNTKVFNEIYDNAAVYFDHLNIEDIAEKMHLVSRDEQFYNQLRKNSLERGKYFSWKKSAEETLSLYNRIQ